MTSPLNLLLIDTEDSRNLMHSADRATLGDDDWRCIRYDCELLDSGAESFASSGENQLNRDRKIFHNETSLAKQNRKTQHVEAAAGGPLGLNVASNSKSTDTLESQSRTSDTVHKSLSIPMDDAPIPLRAVDLRNTLLRLEIEEKSIMAEKHKIEERAKLLLHRRVQLEESANKSKQAEDFPAITRNINAINAILASAPQDKNIAAEVLLALEVEGDKNLKFHSQARELLALARAGITRRWNYMKLFGLLVFFALYCTALLLQNQNSASYDIESRSGFRH